MTRRGKKLREVPGANRVVHSHRDACRDNKSKLAKKHGLPVIKGLHNIGNTCYFNASLQCLARSPYLKELLSHPLSWATLRRNNKDSLASLNISLPDTKSPVTIHFIELISNLASDVHNSPVSSSSTLNPARLREYILDHFPRFKGYGQQDSHEMLRALLSCLKQEEMIRWKRGILNSVGINPKHEVGDADRELVRFWGQAAAVATTVDRLFGGVLLTSLQCCECGTIRTGFEPFLDLSLPIVEAGILDAGQSCPSVADTGKSKQELKRERKKKFQKPRRDRRRHVRQEQLEPEESIFEEEEEENECQQEAVVFSEHEQKEGQYHQNELNTTKTDSGAFVLDYQANNNEHTVDTSPELSLQLEHPLDASPKMEVIVEHCPAVISSSLEYLHVSNVSQLPNGPSEPQNVVPIDFTASASNCSFSSLADSSNSNGCCADAEESDESANNHFSSFLDYPEENGQSQSPSDVMPDSMSSMSTKLGHLEIYDDSCGLQPFGTDELHWATRLSQISKPSRYPCNPTNAGGGCSSLYACLSRFTSPEQMGGSNRVVCYACTQQQGHKHPNCRPASTNQGDIGSDVGAAETHPLVYQDAVRRDLILHPPPLLTIHLKRFHQHCNKLQKSQKQVSFPILLDLNPFCSVLSLSSPGVLRYQLYGVVEHLGRLAGGHYVAYVAVARKPTHGSPTVCGTPFEQKPMIDMQNLIFELTGSRQNQPPKWPWTVHDLVRRVRRCDHSVLADCCLQSNDPGYPAMNGTAVGLGRDHVPRDADPNDDLSNQDDRIWYRCSDSHVEQVTLSTVLRCQAFMLFYARLLRDQ